MFQNNVTTDLIQMKKCLDSVQCGWFGKDELYWLTCPVISIYIWIHMKII